MIEPGFTLWKSANNTKTSAQLGLSVNSSDISAPEVKKIKASVPYRNGDIDFSTFYDGNYRYESREITYECQIIEDSSADLATALSTLYAGLAAMAGASRIYDKDTGSACWFTNPSAPKIKKKQDDDGMSCTLDITFTVDPLITDGTNSWL